MSDLVVRRPDFGIDETVAFQWQPANPAFGLFGNAFTFIAIAFERYVVSATRDALGTIRSDAVAEEADLFVKQEAQHAKAHHAHARAMIARYPGLADTMSTISAAYDELLERESVDFHLAYVANLEATFTPLFKMVLDNRHGLFDGADERVGTLLLWHFVEEIEHRSSALLIQRSVTDNQWYRFRVAPKVFKHVSGVFETITNAFAEQVPADDCHIDPKAVSPRGLMGAGRKSMLGHVPGRDMRSMIRHLITSQKPSHNPAHEPLPAWAATWHDAFNAGRDVATYAGVGL